MVNCFGIKFGRKSKAPSTEPALPPARKSASTATAAVSKTRAGSSTGPEASRTSSGDSKSMPARKLGLFSKTKTSGAASTPSLAGAQGSSSSSSVSESNIPSIEFGKSTSASSRSNSDARSLKSLDTVDSVFDGATVSRRPVESTEKMSVVEVEHKDGQKWMDNHKLHRGLQLPGNDAYFEAFSRLNMPGINAAFGVRVDVPTLRIRMAEWLMEEAEICNEGSGPGKAAEGSLMRRLDTAMPDAGETSPADIAATAFKHEPELAQRFSKLTPAQQQHVAAVLDSSRRPGAQTTDVVALSIATMAGIGVKVLEFKDGPGMTRRMFGDHSSKFATIALTPHTQGCQPVLGRERKPEKYTVEEAPNKLLHVGESSADILGPKRQACWVKPDSNNFFEALKTLPQVQQLLRATVGGTPSAQDIRWHLANKAIKYLADFNAVKDPEERARLMQADPLLAKLNQLAPGDKPANLSESQYFKPLSVLMSRGGGSGGFLSLSPAQKTHVINIARDQGGGQGTEALFMEAAAKLLGMRFRVLSDVGTYDGVVVSAVSEERVGAPFGPNGEDLVEAILLRRPDPAYVDPVIPREPAAVAVPSLASSPVAE